MFDNTEPELTPDALLLETESALAGLAVDADPLTVALKSFAAQIAAVDPPVPYDPREVAGEITKGYNR